MGRTAPGITGLDSCPNAVIHTQSQTSTYYTNLTAKSPTCTVQTNIHAHKHAHIHEPYDRQSTMPYTTKLLRTAKGSHMSTSLHC